MSKDLKIDCKMGKIAGKRSALKFSEKGYLTGRRSFSLPPNRLFTTFYFCVFRILLDGLSTTTT